MPEPRKKTLNYLRAEYFVQNPATVNLGMCIKQATDKLQTIGQRSLSRTGGYMMRLAHFRQATNGSGYFLHLTFETPGEHASIIPRVAIDALEVKVSTIPPPNDAEFMDGDAFLYVNGNDVCLCTTVVTASTVRYFLHEFFTAAMIRSDAGQFEFMNAVDTEKMALIQRKGIKEIEVRASMYRASVDYHKRKGHVVGVLDGTSRYFKNIFGSEHDVTDDSLRVMVTIGVDGRRKKGITIGHKRMQQLAVNVVQNQDNDDDYSIVTEDGERIKPKELILRSVVEIDGMGKSVDRDEAYSALLEYYSELVRSGQLEQ